MSMYDASDPRQVKEKTVQSRAKARLREQVLRQVMSYRQGRMWIYGLLEASHVWRTSFSVDALAMAFAEGERNIGLQLMAEIMLAAPQEYIAMIKEAEEPLELTQEKGEEHGYSTTDDRDTAASDSGGTDA